MKISTQQYAKALHESTKDKSQGEVDAVISGFVKILQKNNQLKLKKEISKKFGEIYNQENGIVEAEIITRYKIQDTRYKQIEDFIKKKYKAEKVVIKDKIDEEIKGGIIIKVGDEVIDGSVERRLKDLKIELSK